jgi:hypothetical protein
MRIFPLILSPQGLAVKICQSIHRRHHRRRLRHRRCRRDYGPCSEYLNKIMALEIKNIKIGKHFRDMGSFEKRGEAAIK